jgi:hypothetical protein
MRERSDDDIALLLTNVSFMAGTWAGTTVGINHFPLRKLDAARMALASRPRALIVNLSERLRIFHSALADVHHPHEPPSVSRQRNETSPVQAGRRRARSQKRAGRRSQS